MELGYEIVKIYEVWNFPEDQRKEGLFADYVNKRLKNKTEATGWPKNCVTDEQKDAYITDYYNREGVQLEPNKIGKNFGRKQVPKLMLNSFGGNLARNPTRRRHSQSQALVNCIGLLKSQETTFTTCEFVLKISWRWMSEKSWKKSSLAVKQIFLLQVSQLPMHA